MEHKKRITILTGHVGSGKTEIAINLAMKEAKQFNRVAVNDFNVENSYFATKEIKTLLEKFRIEVIAPMGLLARVDLPIVPPEIYRVLKDPAYKVIMDVGGDQHAARVLEKYYSILHAEGYELIFVINANHSNKSSAQEIIKTIKSIESESKLTVTGLINNTNFGCYDTTVDNLLTGLKLAEEVSEELCIPFLYTTLSDKINDHKEEFESLSNINYIKRFIS